MDTMKYNHKELPLVPFSELKGEDLCYSLSATRLQVDFIKC